MAKVLTAVGLSKLRPGKSRIEIPDGGCPGLYAVVQSTGTKSWALRFRRPGDDRPAKLALGTVNTEEPRPDEPEPVVGGYMTLSAVRRLVAKLKHEIAQGRDPAAAHMADRRRRAETGTFEDATREFVEQHARKRTRRWFETAALLGLRATGGDELEVIKGGLCDRWRKRPVTEVGEDDVFRVLDEARSKGVPGLKHRKGRESESMARVLYSALSSMFGWLVEKRRVRANPVAALKKPTAPQPRERVLTDEEVVAVWSACDEITEPFGALYRTLLLTGCRLNEVARMAKSELTADGAAWTIPGDRTKNHRPHVVPLPPLARDIVASAAKRSELDDATSACPFVFTTNNRTPISGFSKMKVALDEAMAKKLGAGTLMPPWRVHDLRRTVATGMAEIGIAPHIIEACLNHLSGHKGGVAGVYNRATYAPEKKAALERWAAHVERLVSGTRANVVSMGRRSA